MYLDIHRHSANKGNADKIMRNLFHNEAHLIEPGGTYSLGLHPWHVNEASLNEDIEQILKVASSPNVYAIGEAGLDKAIKIDITIQRKAFQRQIEIAKELQKPMIIHCVKAYDEILSFRKASHHKQPWIIHWFNASPEMAMDLIQKGFFLSFGHMLFKEDSKAYKSFLQIPLDAVFLETDDVDVTITQVYERAASLRKIPLKQLQNQTAHNFHSCFGVEL